MSGERVLIVDDDPQILRAVRTALRARGYEPVTAISGEAALEVLSGANVDVVILDLGLPGIDGHEVIKRVRTWSDVPIIVLSVQEAQNDKIGALDAGADDYVTKPFAVDELFARMRAVRRRADTEKVTPILRFGELEIDLARHLVRLDDADVSLTPLQYKLLEAMATRPGKLLTHGWLLRQVWGPEYGSESHYLREFVRQLRHKLGDDPGRPRWIVTEAGLGYRWRPEPD
jgi:two-component system KDP operon response regulator KdpE